MGKRKPLSFGQHLQKNQDFYIHYDSKNFLTYNGHMGSMRPAIYKNDEGNGYRIVIPQYNERIYNNFIKERQRNINKQIEYEYKQYYKQNLKQSSNYHLNSEEFKKILELIYNKNFSDDFIKLLEQGIKKEIQSTISRPSLSRVSSLNEESFASIARKMLTTHGEQEINNFLHVIDEFIACFEGTPLTQQYAAIQNIFPSHGPTYTNQEISQYLKYLRNNLPKSPQIINKKEIEDFLKKLEQIFYNGKFKNGNQLSARGLSTIFLNRFVSTQLGELLNFQGASVANNAILQKSKGILEKNKTSLDKKVSTGQLKTQLLDDNHSIEEAMQSIKVKVDKYCKNFYITMTMGDKDLTFVLDLGFNIKTYTSSAITTENGLPSNVKMGKGGTLRDAITKIAWNNETMKPILYNIIAHSNLSDFNQKKTQLLYLITKRQSIRGILSNGNIEDFSQMILINDQIFTSWEIINYILSCTQQKKQVPGIKVKIENTKDIYSSNQFIKDDTRSDFVNALLRSRQVNSKINQARIVYHFHLKQLLNGLSRI